MAPVKLPRFVMFKGECKNNLCLHPGDRQSKVADTGEPSSKLAVTCELSSRLRFNSTYRDISGSHEVTSVVRSGSENVVKVRCLANDKLWMMDDKNFIVPNGDARTPPEKLELNCLFEVVLNVSGSEVPGLERTSVALKCLGNGKFLRSNNNGEPFKSLRAEADISTVPSVLMEVSEALFSRRVYEVNYVKEGADFTKGEPQKLLTVKQKNPSRKCRMDIIVAVPYELEQKSTWSNSTSIYTGLSVHILAGLPNPSEAKGRTSKMMFATAMREVNERKEYVNPTIVYKEAEPEEEVTLQLWGSKQTAKVKFTYKFKDIPLDGSDFAEQTAEDGIFEGERWVDTYWKATNLSELEVKPEEAKPEAEAEPESNGK